jgi:predicted nicotinamide N-methyase
MSSPAPSRAQLEEFVRTRTVPAPVPLVPEIALHQAAEVTDLWHASVRTGAWQDTPFWAFPWAGGQALARHVLDHPQLVRGRRVVDFATGSGLLAIAAARAGAAEVLALDQDPFCAAAVTLNAALNGVVLTFRAGDALDAPLAGCEVLLAGDVFYERALAERATRWFRLLSRRGVRVLAGDAGRTYAPRAGFTVRASYDVPTTTAIEAAGLRRASVLEPTP